MQHTAHQAIATRLNMWRVFFTTGVDRSPPGATDAEYGVDQLIDLARMANVPHLVELADLVELMADNYTRRLDLHMSKALMQDEPAPVAQVRKAHARVTLEELDAALAGV